MRLEKGAGSLSHQETYDVALNDDPTEVIGQRLLPVPSDDPKGKSPISRVFGLLNWVQIP